MELGLSLGDTPAAAVKPFFLAEKSRRSMAVDLGLGFCVDFGSEEEGVRRRGSVGLDEIEVEDEEEEEEEGEEDEREGSGSLPVQLNLLPFSPVPRQSSHIPLPSDLPKLPWQRDHGGYFDGFGRSGLDVNMIPSITEQVDREGGRTGSVAVGVSASSPLTNGGFSPFWPDFSIYPCANGGIGRERAEVAERASSRASDEEENGSTRKKLRLSKEQSVYLEESFKEHHTLNPKQKHALAKQLNLQPRQVEVWFQNRRARTKLKQTEVDCEYLKRCCEKLTEENRRLLKELQELRALKTAHPFYMHVPATTLTMCPSCERVASTTTTTGVDANGRIRPNGVSLLSSTYGEPQKTGARNQDSPSSGLPFRPTFHPFNQQKNTQAADGPRQQHSAAT